MSENLPEPSEVSENATYTLPANDFDEVGDAELADDEHIVADPDIEGTEGSES